MVRVRGGGFADAAFGDPANAYPEEPVEAEIIDLDDGPNASDDARAIRLACEAIARYIAPYVEHVRGDVPAVEAERLAQARVLLEDALALLA